MRSRALPRGLRRHTQHRAPVGLAAERDRVGQRERPVQRLAAHRAAKIELRARARPRARRARAHLESAPQKTSANVRSYDLGTVDVYRTVKIRRREIRARGFTVASARFDAHQHAALVELLEREEQVDAASNLADALDARESMLRHRIERRRPRYPSASPTSPCAAACTCISPVLKSTKRTSPESTLSAPMSALPTLTSCLDCGTRLARQGSRCAASPHGNRASCDRR